MGEIDRLDTLAARINAEHRACETAVNAALEHALAAGELLLKVRKSCPHGTWIAWLEENFEGSARTAQAYIRVATRRAEVEAAKAQRSAPLSLDGALKALTRPPSPSGNPRQLKPHAAEIRSNEQQAQDAERYGGWQGPSPSSAARPGDLPPEAFVSFSKPAPKKLDRAVDLWREGLGFRPKGGPHPPEIVAEDLLDYFEKDALEPGWGAERARTFAHLAERAAAGIAEVAAELDRQASARISAEKQRRENERALHAQTKREAEEAKAVKDFRTDTLDHL